MSDTKWFERFDDKMDRIDARLDAMREVQVEQKGVLDHHIARTELAEKGIDLMARRVSRLEKTSTHWSVVGKALAAIAGIAATLGAAFQAWK